MFLVGMAMTGRAARMAPAAFLLAGALRAQSGGDGGPQVLHLLQESRLEVKTGKAGLLGFAGHTHVIRANGFDGEVNYSPDDPAATTIRIRIATDRLEVLTPPDTAEIRKVTAVMRDEVLHVAQFPEITFQSKAVSKSGDGYRVRAEIVMHGQAREVEVPVQVEFRGDTLLAASRFTLRQTDFGMKPVRGGPAGTVRVADEVEFRIEARAAP